MTSRLFGTKARGSNPTELLRATSAVWHAAAMVNEKQAESPNKVARKKKHGLLEPFSEREPYARRVVAADQRGCGSQRCRDVGLGVPPCWPTPVESEPGSA